MKRILAVVMIAFCVSCCWFRFAWEVLYTDYSNRTAKSWVLNYRTNGAVGDPQGRHAQHKKRPLHTKGMEFDIPKAAQSQEFMFFVRRHSTIKLYLLAVEPFSSLYLRSPPLSR